MMDMRDGEIAGNTFQRSTPHAKQTITQRKQHSGPSHANLLVWVVCFYERAY